jgi:hypothetical protein
MNTPDRPYQATPAGDLRQQIIDSRVPKNEREWWASREIEKLERELTAAKAECERLNTQILERAALGRAVMRERDNLETELARLHAELATCKDDSEALVYCQRAENDRLIDDNVELTTRAEKAEAECLKQARLLGMSGEREADLLGKLGCLKKDKERLDWLHLTADGINWQTIDNTHLVTRDAIDAAMKGTP